jgi:hypothetical protein
LPPPPESLATKVVVAVSRHYGIDSRPTSWRGFQGPWDGEPRGVLAQILWRFGYTKKVVAELCGVSPSQDDIRNADRITGWDTKPAEAAVARVLGPVPERQRKERGGGRMLMPVVTRPSKPTRLVQSGPMVTVCGCGIDYMQVPVDHECAQPRLLGLRNAKRSYTDRIKA